MKSMFNRVFVFLKNHSRGILEFVIVFLTLFFNLDSFLVGVSDSNILRLTAVVVPVVIIVLLVLLCFRYYKKGIIDSNIIVRGVFLLLVFFSLIFLTFISNIKKYPYYSIDSFKNSMEYTYLLQLVFIFLAFSEVLIIRKEFFLKYFSFIVLISSISGIILFVISRFLPSLFNILPSINNTLGTPFKVFGLAVQSNNGRLCGFAREPGVFGIYLFFALYYYVFIQKITIQKLYRIIFLVSLVAAGFLSKSTTCYLAILAIFICFIFSKKYKTIVKVVSSLCFLAILCILFGSIRSIIIDKILYGTTSFGSRFLGIPFCIMMFFKNPVTGIGWSSYWEFYKTFADSWQTTDFHLTNTVVFSFSIYGAFFGAIVVYSLFNVLTKEKEINAVNRVIFSIGLIVLLSCENILNSSLFFILLFYSLLETPLFKKMEKFKLFVYLRKVLSLAVRINWRKVTPIIFTLIGVICSMALTFTLAKVLPMEEYGEIQYQIGLMSTLSVVIQFGLPNLLAKNTQFSDDKKKYFSKFLLSFTIISIVIFPIFFTISFFALKQIHGALNILMVFGGAYFSSLALIVSYYQMGVGKRVASSITYYLVPRVLMMASFVCVLVFGWLSFFSSFYMLFFTVSYLVVCIPPIVRNFKFTSIKFSKNEILSILIFLMIAVFSTVESQLGKVFQGEFMPDMVTTAVLGLSTQIMSIVSLFFSSVVGIFRPEFARLYTQYGKEKCISLYKALTTFLACFAITFCVGCSVQPDILLSIFNEGYSVYFVIFLMISVEMFIQSLFGPISTMVSMTGLEKGDLFGGLLNLIVFVVISLTVGRFFWWGVALGVAVGKICSVIPDIILVRKHFGVWPFDKKMLVVFSIETIVSLVVFILIRLINVPLLCAILDLIMGVILLCAFIMLKKNREIFTLFFFRG